jgi:polyribonucleotide nucleotidyltransferase
MNTIKAILNQRGQVIGAVVANKGQITTTNEAGKAYRLSASRKAIKEAKKNISYDGLWVDGIGFANAVYHK